MIDYKYDAVERAGAGDYLGNQWTMFFSYYEELHLRADIALTGTKQLLI